MNTSYNPSFSILLEFCSLSGLSQNCETVYTDFSTEHKKNPSTWNMHFLHLTTYYIRAPVVLGHEMLENEQ